ncbi:MAG: DUF2163 domain-containing protein [Sphingomonas sp.]
MSFLDGALTTIALCWRLERRDGAAIGLTGHDRDLTINGLIHRAAPGMVPSAVKRSDGLDADTMDVSGALTSSAIGEADLLAGRWNGARVRLFAVDWTDPEGAQVPLGEGTIGAVETLDNGFTAELRGASAALDRPVVEETSPECRAELGDERCRVPMAGRRRFARVLTAANAVLTVDAPEPSANAYGFGLLRWLTGPNSGLESAVSASSGVAITLRTVPPFAVEAGVLVELTEGCDKSIGTCAARFANGPNFRGEPYLPGLDLLTRYPGG